MMTDADTRLMLYQYTLEQADSDSLSDYISNSLIDDEHCTAFEVKR